MLSTRTVTQLLNKCKIIYEFSIFGLTEINIVAQQLAEEERQRQEEEDREWEKRRRQREEERKRKEEEAWEREQKELHKLQKQVSLI